MNVIIELNEHVSIENIEGCESEVLINFKGDNNTIWECRRVVIDDLKIALRKLTAK